MESIMNLTNKVWAARLSAGILVNVLLSLKVLNPNNHNEADLHLHPMLISALLKRINKYEEI